MSKAIASLADDEIFTIKTIKEYRKIIFNCIDQYTGRVVDSPGDNILAEFASAVDAVQCAVEMQNKLKKENERLIDTKRLEFRIGVNIGDVVQDEDRIYGDGVNIASRIEGLADPGGVCLSRSAYDQIKKKLGFGFEYMGEHPVKNISEPVRVYKVLMDADVSMPPVEKQRELPDKPSIAVLPFLNMSGDPDQEYFSDGLTEQIINGLCKIRNLFVIARNSSFAYKGKAVNVQQIGKELCVRYVLEGSVQKAADSVRITAQLIDTISGYHLWSENYDRNIAEIFSLQDEITLKLIRTMSTKLVYGEQFRQWKGMTNDIRAFDKYMRAAECYHRNNEKDIKQARKYYKEAINIDKSFDAAYCSLGYTHLLDLIYGWSDSPLHSFEKAEKYVGKALSLNDDYELSHCLLSWIYLFKKQHDEAICEGERAIEINPNGAEAHAQLALVLIFSDKTELAIKLLKRALIFNPIPPSHYYYFLAMAYRLNGQFEKAIEYAKKSLTINADQLTPHVIIAICYSLLNRTKDANKAAETILRIDPNFSVKHYANMLPYKHQKSVDGAVNALRKAGLPD